MSIVVKGEPTAQIDLPSGCMFASCCPYATELCVADRPMLRQRGLPPRWGDLL